MKILKCFLVITALLSAHLTVALAATCFVPSIGYPTIQTAVDDPTCSVVNVAPGAYAENVMIARAVTLNGAQAGQSVAGRTSGGPGESTVLGANPIGGQGVFTIGAASVTIDGFTVKNSVATGPAIGVQIGGGNDSVVLNNFIDGITSAQTDPAGTAAAIWVQNGAANVNIGRNDIRNVSSNEAARGLLIGDISSPAPPPDVVFVHENAISGVSSGAAGASGILISSLSLTSASFFSEQNEFGNVTGAVFSDGIRFESVPLDAAVNSSDFNGLTSASGDVAAVWFPSNTNGNSASIGGNNFNLTAADFGVQIQDPFDNSVGPMNAGCNWWGSPDGPGPVGPGHGAQVSPNVVFSLWRIVPGGDCVGSNSPVTAADCKNGGWITHTRPDGSTFKSQGDCVQFVNNAR